MVLKGTGEGAIFEIKHSHCGDAIQQLGLLYLPLCSYVWPGREWKLMEIVKNWVKDEGFEKAGVKFLQPEDVWTAPFFSIWHRP